MPLPIIEAPKYEVTIPSTGKTVEIRPYLVKEEKILMLALEANDDKAMLRAVKDVVRACTFEKINPDDLTLPDLEFLFIRLRSISVGETSKVILKCQNKECNSDVEYSINLATIEVTKPQTKVSNTIQLTDKVGVILKPILVRDASLFTNAGKNASKVETATQVIVASIESIFDDKATHRAVDQKPDEIRKFVDSLSSSHMEKIRAWLEVQPKLSKDIEYTCPKCTNKSTMTLSGLQSFFA